jgi:hypothetical protein
MMKIPPRVAASVFAGLLALLAAPIQGQPYSVRLVPLAPQSLEQVTLHVDSPGGPQTCVTASVSMDANFVRVKIRCLGTLPLLPPFAASSFDVELGRFPAGTYYVEVLEGNPATPAINVAFTVAERHVFISPYTFPVADYTDHWWNPLESGWGISIHQHTSDRLFAVWFVYSQSGQPVWYTLQPGAWTSWKDYTGPIYKTSGPYFGGPFDSTQVGVAQVGVGTLSFADSNTATFSYTVEGVSGSKPITRLSF